VLEVAAGVCVAICQTPIFAASQLQVEKMAAPLVPLTTDHLKVTGLISVSGNVKLVVTRVMPCAYKGFGVMTELKRLLCFLQALNGFLAKSDGKDKLTALIQVGQDAP
jgi:hypothetical protein